jgi:WD40 repeat protein
MNLLLTADDARGKASIWDMNTGDKLHTISTLHHDKSCLNASFNPQGTLLVTANLGGTAALWDVATGKRICNISSRIPHDFNAVDFNGDGTLIMATSFGDNPILVWEAATGNLRYILKMPNQKTYVHSAMFNKKGDRIIVDYSGTTPIHVYDAYSGTLLYKLEKENVQLCKAALSPDGNHAITMSEKSDACVWDLTFPKELASGDLTKEQVMLLHALEDEFVKHSYVRLAWIAEKENISLDQIHQILNSFSADAKNHIIATYKIKSDSPHTYRKSLIAAAVAAIGITAYFGYKLFKR